MEKISYALMGLLGFLAIAVVAEVNAFGHEQAVIIDHLRVNENIESGVHQLLAEEGDGDHFGASVSIDNHWAVIGAPEYSLDGKTIGVVYVYHFDGESWINTQQLISSDDGSYSYFGGSVSISGDKILIGAWRSGIAEYGAVFAYEFDGTQWVETQKISASDENWGEHFGWSVSLSGDQAVIGAYKDDEVIRNSGSAYVFEYQNGVWVETQKLISSEPIEWGLFGISVDVEGNRVIVGEANDYDFGTTPGAAHVFEYNGQLWEHSQKITPSDGARHDRFGAHVIISGEKILISAPNNYEDAPNTGAVYSYELGVQSWEFTQKIFADPSIGKAYAFGTMDVHEDQLLVGSKNGHVGGQATLFKYRDGSWHNSHTFTSNDVKSSALFGYSVAMTNDWYLISDASHSNINGQYAGAAYAFKDSIFSENFSTKVN